MMAPKWSSWACVSTSPTRFFRSFTRKLISGMMVSMPGKMFFVAEGDAEIDRQPRPLPATAEAVDRQVHADLADAAKRGKGEFVAFGHRCAWI